jgi:hypothetical protein
VVLAPSMHVSGRRYCWEGSSRPNETPVAPLPEWLFKLATTSKANGYGNGPVPPIKDKIHTEGSMPHWCRLVALCAGVVLARRRSSPFCRL